MSPRENGPRAITACLALVLGAACAPETPDLSDLSGYLYFASNRTGDFEIFRMRADGTDLVNLSRNPSADDSFPAVSPDGTRIAFVRGNVESSPSWEIWTMRWDGSDLRRLTSNGAPDAHPDWSPDGTTLVFTSWRDASDQEIYVMDAAGTNQRRLTFSPGIDNDPDWSPDGSWIAFKSTRASPPGACQDETFCPELDLYVMSADGTFAQRVADASMGLHDPDFTPDGTRIAYLRSAGSGLLSIDEVGISLLDLATGQSTDLTAGGQENWYTSYAPDAAHIAFVSARDGNNELYVMDPDGGNQRRVTTHFLSDEFPAWGKVP